MPAILPAAAAAVAAAAPAVAAQAVAQAAVVAAIKSVAINALINLGVSAVMSALQPQVGTAGRTYEWTLDPDAPIPFAFGRVGVAGSVVYPETFGPDKMYYGFVSVLSGAGPIDGYETFRGDDETVSFDGNGKAITSQWRDEMWMRTRLGTQPDTALITPTGLKNNVTLPGWGTANKLSGKASYMLVLGENSKRSAYPNGEPKPLWVIRGLKCYDPRLDSTYPGGLGSCRLSDPATWVYSQNPIIHALKWSLGLWEGPTGKGAPGVDYQVGGIGAKPEGIDFPSFVSAANIADANGWTSAAYPTTDDTKSQVLDAFLQAGGAIYAQKAGKIACIQRGAPRTSIVTISAADTAGPIEFDAAASRINRINAIRPRYWSEAHRWQLTALPEVTDASYIAQDNGRRPRGIDYPFVTNATQCGQLAALQIANTREGIAGTIPLKPHLQRITPGDAFTITEPGFVLDGLKCLCLSTDYDPATGIHNVTFVSETDSKYAFALGQSPIPPVAPTLVATDITVTPPLPGDWNIVVRPPAPGGGQIPGFDLTGFVSNDTATAVLVEWGFTNDPTDAGDWTQAYSGPPTATSIPITGVDPGQSYYIAVSYIRGQNTSARTVYGPYVSGALIAQAGDVDTTPPAVPTGLAVTSTSTPDAAGNPTVRISATWTANTDEDIDGYDTEITEGAGTPITRTVVTATDQWAPARTGVTYSVRVRARDRSGNVSAWTSAASIVAAGDTTPPSAPTGFASDASLGTIFLRWTNPSQADTEAVEVYENTISSSGSAVAIATVNALPGGAGRFSRSGLGPGETRYYWLKAIDTSGNRSVFSASVTASTPRIVVTDFASGIAPVELFASDAAAGTPTLGRVYFNTTTSELRRGNGSQWTAAVPATSVTGQITSTQITDGAISTPKISAGAVVTASLAAGAVTADTIAANAITAGKVAAGAISATEIAAGAITTDKLGANAVTAAKIAAGTITATEILAGSITGDRFNTGTNLPGTITVGGTGVSIDTVQNRSANPAAQVNAGTTTILPGRILIQGAQTLDGWRNGTEINGGAIAANSVETNRLTVGNRGVSFDLLNFTTSGNTLLWTAGRVAYVNNAGATVSMTIVSGSYAYSASGGDVTYIYWTQGSDTLLATKSLSVARGANTVIVGSYYGGTLFTATYGRTVIDGDQIKTGAVTADKITATSLSAITGVMGTLTAGVVQNSGATTFLDLVNSRAQFRRGSYDLRMGTIGSGVALWYGPTSIGIGGESRTNGVWAFGDNGVVYYGSAVLTTGGGAAFYAAPLPGAGRVGTRTSPGSVTTATVQAGVYNFTAPVTFAWVQTAGDSGWTITNPNGDVTAFSNTVDTGGEIKRGSFVCTITNGNGQVVQITVGAAVIYNI